METILAGADRRFEAQGFKSYYVVWKQTYEIKRMEGIIFV